MVSVKFVSRLKHPVTLAWIKKLAALSSPPEGVAYIGEEGLAAVKGMALVNRGRLSVQPVSDEAYDAIVAMGEKGGMDELPGPKAKKVAKEGKQSEEVKNEDDTTTQAAQNGRTKTKKAPSDDDVDRKPKKSKKEPRPPTPGTRRSTRLQG